MKKIFTLIFGLIGLVTAANAATVDDLVKINQTYDLVLDKANKGGKLPANTLFGDNHFITKKELAYATNKGSWDENWETYGGGVYFNSTKLKDGDQAILFKTVGGAKITIWHEKHASRKLTITVDGVNKAEALVGEEATGITTYTLEDDATVKVWSPSGDNYCGRILVEVPVQPGQPIPTVGEQTKGADGVWYKEVSAVADVNGTACELYYTTDGNDPDNTSAKYVAPLKITKDCTVKFTSYLGGRKILTSSAPVAFEFAAPSITAEGNIVTIVNAENIDGDIMVSVNGAEEAKYEAPITLEKSASVKAYTVIKNAENDFVSLSKSIEVLLIQPIAENLTLAVNGTFEEGEPDESGNPTYVVDATVDYNDTYLYYRGFTLKAVPATGDQVLVDGKRYPVAFQLNDPGKLTFIAPEGKDINIEAHFALNSHKNDDDMRCGFNITPANGKAEAAVNGTFADNVTDGGVDEDNVVKYTAKAGNTYTISKWSNTGNMFISYMTFTPVDAETEDAIHNVNAAAVNSGVVYNLAGQKVAADYKGIVIKNGVKVVVK